MTKYHSCHARRCQYDTMVVLKRDCNDILGFSCWYINADNVWSVDELKSYFLRSKTTSTDVERLTALSIARHVRTLSLCMLCHFQNESELKCTLLYSMGVRFCPWDDEGWMKMIWHCNWRAIWDLAKGRSRALQQQLWNGLLVLF